MVLLLEHDILKVPLFHGLLEKLATESRESRSNNFVNDWLNDTQDLVCEIGSSLFGVVVPFPFSKLCLNVCQKMAPHKLLICHYRQSSLDHLLFIAAVG